mmetsp:Transcript_120082/g.187543  ORF Transcript_120082/g.187543 Transcript_120082/m.187543 type:complete len:89 (+) Transcript_120082:1002-1268(+)
MNTDHIFVKTALRIRTVANFVIFVVVANSRNLFAYAVMLDHVELEVVMPQTKLHMRASSKTLNIIQNRILMKSIIYVWFVTLHIKTRG